VTADLPLWATLLNPAAVVLFAAVVALVVPRAATAVGLSAALAATGWFLVVPDGAGAGGTYLGVAVTFVALDPTARVVGLAFAVVAVAAVLYARAVGADGGLLAAALGYAGASFGAVLAGDWLTLVVWWELMAVASTVLVWRRGGAAVRAGFRYALVHGVGGGLLLTAVALDAATTGSVAMGAIAPGLPAVLAALGIGVNVGFVGLHAWLPDTYPRPHVAASVFLSVYTTKTGVYALLRAFPDGGLWLAYGGAAMAVLGVTYALVQDDMRRLLSYHIQSQVGYMVAGVGVASALATAGALAHVFNHVLYKALLFMVVGLLIARTGRERLSHLGGLGRRMPLVAGVFAVAAFAIAGVPGFNGFVSKGMLLDATSYGGFEGVFWLLTLAGVGTVLSFAKLGYYAFLRPTPDDLDAAGVADAAPATAVPLLGLAGLCVLFGLAPGALFALVDRAGAGLPASASAPYSASHLAKGVAVTVAGVVAFALLRTPLKRVGRLPDVDAVYNPAVFAATRALVAGLGRLGTAAVTARRALDGAREATLARLVARADASTDVGRAVLAVTAVLALALLGALA
jgi:multicomponent Na+:H+ antiporter subunit D